MTRACCTRTGEFHQYTVSDWSDSAASCGAVFVETRKSIGRSGSLFSPAVAPQNIEITHDLIATADRVADHAQRIINLKN
jgi:hypothetical protein